MMTYSVPTQRGMTLAKALKKDLSEGSASFNESYVSMKDSFNKHASLINTPRSSGSYNTAFNQFGSA